MRSQFYAWQLDRLKGNKILVLEYFYKKIATKNRIILNHAKLLNNMFKYETTVCSVYLKYLKKLCAKIYISKPEYGGFEFNTYHHHFQH